MNYRLFLVFNIKRILKVKLDNRQFNSLLDKTNKVYKPLTSFIALQEAESALSHVRFIQDTATNWVPKAAFSRSKADFSEATFLELTESVLVYYMPALLGEKLFRKVFSKKLPEKLQNLIPQSAGKLLNNKNLNQAELGKLLSIKAAIALSCMCIPLTEFCLNYIKNLLTLKLFKQSDFNNIANLNKIKTENNDKQEKVRKSAKKHIAIAGVTYLACLGTSLLLAFKGDKSKALQNLSKLILEPGTKLFPKKPEIAKFFNKYFSLDFADNAGKLVLSRGQLTSCVLIGGVGYFGAAKDRGKQNFLEVLTRFPLVGFYIITGSELFEKGFKKFLHNKGAFKDVINEKLRVPKLNSLPQMAEYFARKNNTTPEKEFHRLLKAKVIITGVPFLFSMGMMGFFIAGMTRFWTQYRYNKEKEQNKISNFSGLSNINKDLFNKFRIAIEKP